LVLFLYWFFILLSWFLGFYIVFYIGCRGGCMTFLKSVSVVSPGFGLSKLGYGSLFAGVGKAGNEGKALPYIAISAGIGLGALIWAAKRHPGYMATFLVGAGVAKVDSARKQYKKPGHRG
jgi:hypothetical protein